MLPAPAASSETAGPVAELPDPVAPAAAPPTRERAVRYKNPSDGRHYLWTADGQVIWIDDPASTGWAAFQTPGRELFWYRPEGERYVFEA